MIKYVGKNKCIVVSESGKRLFPAKGKKPVSRAVAKKNLARIEMFKHMRAKNG
jgi:hypothetical protein